MRGRLGAPAPSSDAPGETNPAGMTPTTVRGVSFNTTVVPSALGLAPNSRCHVS